MSKEQSGLQYTTPSSLTQVKTRFSLSRPVRPVPCGTVPYHIPYSAMPYSIVLCHAIPPPKAHTASSAAAQQQPHTIQTVLLQLCAETSCMGGGARRSVSTPVPENNKFVHAGLNIFPPSGKADTFGSLSLPHHATQHRTVPYDIILDRTIPHHTIPYWTVLYHTIPYRTIPCLTAPCDSVPYLSIVRYATVPYLPYLTMPYNTTPYRTLPSQTAPYLRVAKAIPYHPPNAHPRQQAHPTTTLSPQTQNALSKGSKGHITLILPTRRKAFFLAPPASRGRIQWRFAGERSSQLRARPTTPALGNRFAVHAGHGRRGGVKQGRRAGCFSGRSRR